MGKKKIFYIVIFLSNIIIMCNELDIHSVCQNHVSNVLLTIGSNMVLHLECFKLKRLCNI